MKNILFLFSSFFILFVHPSYATVDVFDLIGPYCNRFHPHYQARFSVEKAAVILNSDLIENARFETSVAPSDEVADLDFPPNTAKIRGVGFRETLYGFGNRLPINHVALLLQRLWPSPDGGALIPNQGTKSDPIRDLTPHIIGVILNYLRDNTGDAGGLATVIEGAYKASDKKIVALKRKALHDFATTVIRAVVDGEANPDLYPKNFIHNTLLAFALHKAARATDPQEEMNQLLSVMPDVVDPAAVPPPPFTDEEYETILERLEIRYGLPQNGQPYTREFIAAQNTMPRIVLTEREKLVYMFGRLKKASPMPKVHHTGTSTFQGTSFPNCGEMSLLNVINSLAANFESPEKEVNVESFLNQPGMDPAIRDYLEHPNKKSPEAIQLWDGILAQHAKSPNPVDPRLVRYYSLYPTTDAQRSRDAMQLWTDLCSAHDLAAHPGLSYKSGGGTCEIINGTASMMAVVRSLFPDEHSRAIDGTTEMCDSARIIATLNRLVAIFSCGEKEKWSWKLVNDKGENVDPTEVPNGKAEIAFFKEGTKNIPTVNDQPIEDELIRWKLSKGHYTATNKGDDPDQVQASLAVNIVETFFSNPEQELSQLDHWILKKSSMVNAALLMRTGLDIEEDEEGPLYARLRSAVGSASDIDFKRLTIGQLCIANRFDHISVLLAASVIEFFKIKSLYLMAANVLGCLPEQDSHTIILILSNYINEEGTLALPESYIHPRIAKKIQDILAQLSDQKVLYDCLKGCTNAPSKLFDFFFKKITDLSPEQVVEFILEIIEDDAGDKVFDPFIARFGDRLARHPDGSVDTAPFDAHPSLQGKSVAAHIIKKAKPILWQRMIRMGLLRREDFLVQYENFYFDDSSSPCSGVYYLSQRLETKAFIELMAQLGIKIDDVPERNQILVNMFYYRNESDQIKFDLLEGLGVTREHWLTSSSDVPAPIVSVVYFSGYSQHQTEEDINAFHTLIEKYDLAADDIFALNGAYRFFSTAWGIVTPEDPYPAKATFARLGVKKRHVLAIREDVPCSELFHLFSSEGYPQDRLLELIHHFEITKQELMADSAILPHLMAMPEIMNAVGVTLEDSLAFFGISSEY